MELIHGIPVFGTPLFDAIEQMEMLIKPTACRVALMADHHLGYSMPIGGVAAYTEHVSPSGVGYDIGCGNKAVRLQMTPENEIDVAKRINEIMDEVWKSISFGVGRTNNDDDAANHRLFDEHVEAWTVVQEISKELGHGRDGLKQIAQNQLGTVGSGNHYVDIFVDENGHIWIGVHFGSRGLGHKIASYFVKRGGGKDGMNEPPVLFKDTDELGRSYIQCMELAGAYAYAGRDWVCHRVAQIVGAPIVEQVHNHHNFAWRESVDGQMMWVVRKGATPAFPGQQGFIGGSMGENAVIVQGVDHEEAQVAMYSTIHGAGRMISRSEAKGKVNRRGEVKRAGTISREMMMEWVQKSGVCLRGAGVDESPHCYKRLPEVLDHHKNTIKIIHVLKPIGVAMAGPDIVDPYKD